MALASGSLGGVRWSPRQYRFHFPYSVCCRRVMTGSLELVHHNKSVVCRPVDCNRSFAGCDFGFGQSRGVRWSPRQHRFVCQTVSLPATGDLLITTSLWSADLLITTGRSSTATLALGSLGVLGDVRWSPRRLRFVCHTVLLPAIGDLLITTSLWSADLLITTRCSSTVTLASGSLRGVRWSPRPHRFRCRRLETY
jgi:hypothetical protein